MACSFYKIWGGIGVGGLQIVPKSIYSQTAPVFAVDPLAQKVEHLPEGECQDKMIGVVADQEEKGGVLSFPRVSSPSSS